MCRDLVARRSVLYAPKQNARTAHLRGELDAVLASCSCLPHSADRLAGYGVVAVDEPVLGKATTAISPPVFLALTMHMGGFDTASSETRKVWPSTMAGRVGSAGVTVHHW